MREKLERERDEVERIHEMTEEERRLYFRQNPTTVTNKMPKGKYKFLQKYYHRGAFYLVSETSRVLEPFGRTVRECRFGNFARKMISYEFI